MAGNKKSTPLDAPKVKRGVKEALTPGVKPEKEQTPVEDVISRELTKIVEQINFDAKFQTIQNAIESRPSETLLPVLEKISDKLNPILGALYGISSITDNTTSSALLSKLGNLDPKLTTFGPIDAMLNSIYKFLTENTNDKSSGGLEDLSIALSAEIKNLLETIDNRPILKDLSKTLEEMKASVLSNSSVKNINRIYSKLEVISKLISNNKPINYNLTILDVASKINKIRKILLSNAALDAKSGLKISKTLNSISSAIRKVSQTNYDGFSSSLTTLKEVSKKLESIDSKSYKKETNLILNELLNVKQILTNDIVSKLKQKPTTIDYTSDLKSINKSIENIASSNSAKSSDVEINFDAIIDELKNISKSINNINVSSNTTDNSNFNELQNINSSISELSKSISNSPAISEIVNKLSEIVENMSINSILDSLNATSSTLSELSSNVDKFIDSYSDNTSNIKDSIADVSTSIKSISLPQNTSVENYDSIIESINDNTNAIIDLISQKIVNIINPITKLLNTDDFNLRTAQIIDAINSITFSKAESTDKGVNTKALQYDININASGLDTETVEALIDLSKISTDSNDYLNNLNDILSGLSNLETINNIKLDSKNLKNIVDSMNSLNKININTDPANPFSINYFKSFINEFAKIDFSYIKEFDESNLESIKLVLDTINSFSKLKLDNFNKNIKALDAEKFVELLKNLKDIPIYDKETNTTMTAVSELFNVVSSISGFDNSKFENLSSNLRDMIKLTEKSSGSKNKNSGLIHTLIHNIEELSSQTKQTSNNTKNISEMLNLIYNISKYGVKEFEELEDIAEILVTVTDKDKPYLYKVFKNIDEIGTIISGWDSKNGPTVSIREQLKLINGFSSNITVKSVFSLAISSTIALMALNSLSQMFKQLEVAYESSKNVGEYTKIINSALSEINSIESIDINKIENLNEGLSVLMSSFIYLKILAFISSKEIDISGNIDVLKNLAAQVNSIEGIKDTNNIESLNSAIKSILEVNIWLAAIGITVPLAYFGASGIEKEIPLLNNVIKQLNGMKTIDKRVENTLKSLTLVKHFIDINIVLSVVGITMPLAYFGAFAIDKEISLLSAIVGKLNELKPLEKGVVDNLKTLALIIVAASGVLLIGALVGGFVLAHFLEILGFTVVLSAFIFLTIGAFNIATRGMKEAKLNAGEFAKLLAISAGIMIIGGLITTLYWKLILGAFAFTYVLSAFIFLTIGAFNIATRGMKEAKLNAKEFAKLLAISAGIMIIGGLITTVYWKLILGAFAFTYVLGAFILLTIGAFNIATIGMDEAAKNAKDFAILLGVSATIMLLGGLIILNYPKIILGSLGFSLLLGLFIFLTIGALNLATKGMKKAEQNAKEFAIIIGISAAALIIGGLFMLIPGMPLAVLEFAAILSVFMFITLSAFSFAANKIKTAKQTAIGFSVVMLLTSAAILIGGALFLLYPGLDVMCLEFAGIAALFILIFGVTIWALGKIDKKSLLVGELALAGITVIIGLFGYAFTYVAEAMDMLSKVNDPLTQLAIMGSVFAAMVLMVAGVTAIISGTGGIGAAAIAAAEGLIAGVVGLIWLLGKAMSAIAQSMSDLEKVKDFEAKPVIEAIGNYISLIPSLMPLASPAVVISMLAVKSSVGSMSDTILAIATSVKEVCDLKTKDGRQLTSSDFTLAAQNVKSVVTILGYTLLDIYKENKEIFSSGSTITDLLGADSAFSRVAKSCATMGELITDISAGVKDFAELKMPIYDDNGKIKGYRTMTDRDFKMAAKSVKNVVTCLGYAMIDIYKSNEEMFKWQLIGDNPFVVVTESCGTLGKLITDISAGVKDFAELKMPIYDDKGQIKGYRSMTDKDFDMAAQSIEKVITCLANAIINIYEKHPNLFTDSSSWHTSADKTPFGMVTKSMLGIGALIKEGADAINAVAGMDVDFDSLGDKFDNKGKMIQEGKVSKVISTLARSVYNVYKIDPNLFTDSSTWHTSADKTPFGMVTKSMDGIGPLIKGSAEAINAIAAMKVDFKDLEDTRAGAGDGKVSKVVSLLPKAVYNVWKMNPTLFEDDSFWHTDPKKTPFGMVMQCLNTITPFVEKAIKNVGDINSMPFKGSDLDEKGDLYKKISGVVKIIPKAVIDLYLDETYGEYFTSSYEKAFTTMGTMYNKYKTIIENATGAYNKVLELKLTEESLASTNGLIKTLLSSLADTIIGEMQKNQKNYANTPLFESTVKAFEYYNTIIESATNAYGKISESLSKIGVKGKGGIAVINNITSQFGTMVSKLSSAIATANTSFDSSSILTFVTNISGFSAAVEQLGATCEFISTNSSNFSDAIGEFVSTYEDIPSDFSNYNNLIKAIEGVTTKTAEIKNLDSLKSQQEILGEYVKSLNSLDVRKTTSLNTLMDTMNKLAAKLGSLDKFTNLLNKKLSTTLTNLATQIKHSETIINTAAELQKKRHTAITESINQIKTIMDQKLIVEVNHQSAQTSEPGKSSGSRDTTTDISTGGFTGGGSVSGAILAGSHGSIATPAAGKSSKSNGLLGGGNTSHSNSSGSDRLVSKMKRNDLTGAIVEAILTARRTP